MEAISMRLIASYVQVFERGLRAALALTIGEPGRDGKATELYGRLLTGTVRDHNFFHQVLYQAGALEADQAAFPEFGSPAQTRDPIQQGPFEQKPVEPRPFQQRPFQQRPAQPRPFQQRPFQQRPAQPRPFQQKPVEPRPFQQRPALAG